MKLQVNDAGDALTKRVHPQHRAAQPRALQFSPFACGCQFLSDFFLKSISRGKYSIMASSSKPPSFLL